LSSIPGLREGVSKSGRVRQFMRWLDALAHPPLAIEISRDRLAGVRWGRARAIEGFAVEALPAGTIAPSPVETNIVNVEAARTALARVCGRLGGKDEDVALLLPDPVVRVFVQHFEDFPRSSEEGMALLRWKLKKSVPFEAEEMLLSYMRRAAREGSVDVVTALARVRIVREYEELAASAGLHAGVIMSSSLAAAALLEDARPTVLARISDTALTMTVVRDGELCGYRCTELPARGAKLTPQMLLDEIFPVAAYYQGIWKEGIQSLRLGGLGARLPEFVTALESEFHCKVESPLHFAPSEGRIPADAKPLVEQELEGLVGWMMNRG
jgi:type IV pilus assembly protein PilM